MLQVVGLLEVLFQQAASLAAPLLKRQWHYTDP